MRIALLGFVALAVGLASGFVLGRAGAPETTVAVTEQTTVTVTEPAPGLPEPVARTHSALLAAAESGDYEAVQALIPADGIRYTFGGPVEGGPVAYWQELEQETGEWPLETLTAILRMPYTLVQGIYVWPFAYGVPGVADLTAHERALLAPLGPIDQQFVPDTGYVGWRAGIDPDGDWVFFVVGD